MVDQLVNSTLNAQRIANVEDCFGSSGQPLAVEGRVLVGEGVLTKMCRKKAKPRQFFLFNDILVYGNIMINKKKYNKQHIIPLEEVKLENLPDDEIPSMKNGWLIRTPTKSFAVYAATATEKSEWMSHINKCLEELLNKTGKKPSTEHAAVWVPDAEANTCMHCRKSQFTIINRKHHCRKCGAVVCANCSNKKFLLPSQSSKPLRVCLSCYDTLSRARVDFTPESMKEKAIAAAINNNPVSIPTSPMSQDSSQDDDSDDEEEEEEKTRKNSEHDPCEGMEKLTIDDKPTFYGDETKTTEGKSAATEIATAAIATVVIETTGSLIIHETSNQVTTSSSSSTVHESSSAHSYSAPTETSADSSSSNAGGDSSCGGGDSGGGGGGCD